MKKLFSLLLTLVMVLTLGISTRAYAAESGSITIQNASVGTTYTLYRPFLATYGDQGAAYTILNTNPWFPLVQAKTDLFVLARVGTTSTYNVALAAGKTGADVVAWVKSVTPGAFAAANINPLQTLTAETPTVQFADLPYGYYVIVGSNGTAVTITNATAHVTVIDKNQMPGWYDPDMAEDGTQPGKNVLSLDGTTWGPTNTASITNVVSFKINAFAPKYAGDKEVDTYTFTDTLGAGFTFNNDLQVKLNGNEIPSASYTLAVLDNTLTLTLPVGITYPSDAQVEITYTATVDADAVYDNVNAVAMDWTLISIPYDHDGDPTTPMVVDHDNDPTTAPLPVMGTDINGNPTVDHDNDPATATVSVTFPNGSTDAPMNTTTHTYIYGFNLQKYKDSVGDANKLTGAAFRLYNAAIGGTEIQVEKLLDGTYEVSANGGAQIEAGYAQIFGLAAGTYYLEEVVTPTGFNPLTARVAVVISAEGDVVKDGVMDTTTDIVNLQGTVLPSTGGVGTTIFYLVGGLLMFAAVVLLVTRKRMSAKAE